MSDPKVNEDEIIDLIETYYRMRQPPPSIREIADHFGVARGTAEYHIGRMVKKGLLKRAPGVARGISVSESVMVQEGHHA